MTTKTILSVAFFCCLLNLPVESRQLKVALWGDMPYVGHAVSVFEDSETINGIPAGTLYKKLSASISGSGALVAIHAGDTKAGPAPCGEVSYHRFEELSNSLSMPSLLTLGDNDWTDCHIYSAGNYNPLERLQYVRARYFDKRGYVIMGNKSAEVHIVRTDASRGYPENQRFGLGRVMFILVHVTGSHNNMFATPEQPDGAPCPQSLQAVDPGCRGARAEFESRDAAVNLFLRQSFDLARQRALVGVMVVIQGSIFLSKKDQSGQIRLGYASFWSSLRQEAKSFSGQVALVHGDHHTYASYRPDALVPNLVAIQVPGSRDIGWVLANIDNQSNQVFSFTHVDLTP